MIDDIDPIKSAVTSLISAGIGTFSKYVAVMPVGFISLEHANTFFQHAAWTIAILAGIVSIINGVKKMCCKNPK